MSTIPTTPAAPAPDPQPLIPGYLQRLRARQGFAAHVRPSDSYEWLICAVGETEEQALQFAKERLGTDAYQMCVLPFGQRPGGSPPNPVHWRLPKK